MTPTELGRKVTRMGEIDGYERNEHYYRERMNELRAMVSHMDVHCPSFCVEPDGIRVAVVAELLRNALCCQIEEVVYLLSEYVKPTEIKRIVDDAVEYAREHCDPVGSEEITWRGEG